MSESIALARQGEPTESRSRGDSDQAGNNPTAKPHETELLGVDVVKQDPADAAAAGREVGVDDDVDGSQAQVGGAGAIEGEPAEPDKDGADAHEQRVVRLKVHAALLGLGRLVREARAQHEGPGEGAEAAGDVHGARAGEVVEAELEQPAARVPLPVGEASKKTRHQQVHFMRVAGVAYM